MSSTTDRADQEGQVLVLFAGALVTLLVVAALAFDVGMMLTERRDQQNAADAAALAGARYVTRSTTFHGSCAAPGGVEAVVAACEVAAANDFQDAADDEDVFVDIPPVHAAEAIHRAPGNVEVRIASNRPSIFGGIIGRAAWPIGAMAIASNQKDISYPFGMLALNETACKAINVSGGGQVIANSAIQSNSSGEDCGGPPLYSLIAAGGASVHADGCRAAGSIDEVGGATLDCGGDEESFSFGLPDPLRALAAPARPAVAPSIKEWRGGPAPEVPPAGSIPDFCPGRQPPPANKVPSATNPGTCTLDGGREFVLSPGLYAGGLDVKGGATVYLLPGIYWIGGGGVHLFDGRMLSVDDELDRTPGTCTAGTCTGGGGILIYNSKLSDSGRGGPGTIELNGSGVQLNLLPMRYPFDDSFIDLVIFQDRTIDKAVTLNGASSDAGEVRGIVYAPAANVTVNGSSSTFSVDQIIADTFGINGNGGTVNVLRETGINAVLEAAGLVE